MSLGHECIYPNCNDEANVCWYDYGDEWYLCIFHMVKEGFCWCCGKHLGSGSERKLCKDCYVPGESDEPFSTGGVE